MNYRFGLHTTPHCLHLSSNKIFLLNKLCFAGIAFLHTRHMKCRTLLGMLSPQTWFQVPLCRYWLAVRICTKLSLVRNFEPELIIYLPEGVKGQMILSSIRVWLNGMLRTKAASSGDNNPCTKFKSHVDMAKRVGRVGLGSSQSGWRVNRVGGSIGLAGQTGCESKRVIFKQVNRVVGWVGLSWPVFFKQVFFFFFWLQKQIKDNLFREDE